MQYELKHWIAGKQIKSRRTIARRAPATGELLSRTCVGGKAEVDQAVTAARLALKKWATLSLAERCGYVLGMSDWLAKEYGEAGKPAKLKDLISLEVGKPLPEADVEVIETSDFMRFFADHASATLKNESPELDPNLWPTKRSFIQYQPRGVVGIIKPWNYPLEMIAWSLAPALVAGNTVIIKPSEKSPATASLFREMAIAVGLPEGVINIVYGDAETGKLISDARGIDFVSFTGSTAAGRDVAKRCAARLCPYAVEMGGNDAAIVLDDVDIELAANGLAWGAFCNAGQVCVGIKRAYVSRKIFPQLLAKVTAIAKSLRIGSDVGPIIDDKQLKRIREFVDDAVQKGAHILAGGERVKSNRGYFFKPTVLTEIPAKARLLREECFGPILPLIPFDTVEEAISHANETPFGLGASIWTSNLEKGEMLASQVEAGMVWINDVNVAFPQTPWGGFKESGVGFELSGDALREYTVRKHISVEMGTDQRRAWWYPYE